MNTAEFLTNWYAGHTFQLTSIYKDGGGTRGQSFDDPTSGANWAQMENTQGRNVYFHVNVGVKTIIDEKTGKVSGKLSKEEVTNLIGWHLDFDPPKGMGPGPEYDQWLADASARLPQLNPSIINSSGRGLQGFWRMAGDIGATPETIERVEQMNKALVRMVGGDPAATDVSRIMKLPGTIAYPNPSKRADGWDDNPAYVSGGTLQYFDQNAMDGFESWLHTNAPAPAVTAPLTPVIVDEGEITEARRVDLVNKINSKIRGGKNGGFPDWGMPEQPQYGDGASEIWSWLIRAALEVTSRRDIVHETLMGLAFVDLTYKPTSGNATRREKCQRDFDNYFDEALVLTAAKRQTGTLEGLKELAKSTAVEGVEALAGHASKLSRTEKADLLDFVSGSKETHGLNNAIAKPLKKAMQQEVDKFRIESGQISFDMAKAGPLAPFFMVANEQGKPMIFDRRGGTAPMTVDAFLQAMSYLPPVAMPGVGDKVVQVPAAKYWTDDPETERYDFSDWNPSEGEIWLDKFGRSVRNIYVEEHRGPAPQGLDCAPYLHILTANYPDPGDQDVILGALAFAIQKPGEMLLWAPVLQGSQGCGKGSLIKAPLLHAIGMKNLGVASPKALSGDYNGYMYRKTTVVVDEIGERSKANMADLIEELKEPVSETIIPFRIMRVDPFSGENFACWFFMTNHMDSMLANDINERRWAQLVSVLQTQQETLAAFPRELWSNYPDVVAFVNDDGADWFTYFRAWWKMGGAENVRGMLECYKPARPGRAPATTTKALAVAASLPDLVVAVRQAVADREPGFRGGYVSKVAVEAIMEADGFHVPKGKYFGQQMRQAGFAHSVRIERKTVGDSRIFPDIRCDGKTRLYFIDPTMTERFDPIQIVTLYDQEQADPVDAQSGYGNAPGPGSGGFKH